MRLLLTDLDNTWFNWVDFFAPSLRAMVHALSRATGVSEDEIYSQLRRVYADHQTLEYQSAIQELTLYKELGREERARALHGAIVAFGQTRRVRLSLYEGAKETLEWLNNQNVRIIGVTNAAIPASLGRLKSLGIQKYFTALVGSHGGSTESIRRPGITKLISLDGDQLKPNPEAYRRALEALACQSSHSDLWALGDSPSKDLAPASKFGAKTIWARYGRHVNAKNFETLLRVTHWSEERVQESYGESPFVPDFTIDSPRDLMSIIPEGQGRLF